MSVLDQFGRKGATVKRRDLPPANGLPPLPKIATIPAPHEDHAQAVLYVSGLADENKRLRGELDEINKLVELAKMRIRDLEQRDRTREALLENYRTYAVSVKNSLKHVINAARLADEEAMNVIEPAPPVPMPDLAAGEQAVEQELEPPVPPPAA